ncbi:MAG: M48 family metallopeptidase [Ignavibacteria bacterium]|nr:M48 family metallopeptidase [Ignavibacteria bacterium]
MDENRKILAKKYEKIKLTVNIIESIFSMILLLLYLYLGYSKKLEVYAYGFTSNPYIALIIYGFVLAVISSVISFPIEYIFGYRLEHKFGLSNLTFWGWIGEKVKAALIGGVIGAPIVFLFYWLLLNYTLWWFYLGCIVFGYSVILAKLAPVLIFPLFYKFTPIENVDLKNKLMELCTRAGFKVSGVFKFNMSKTTKKANAAFTGLGKTKRIILGDTLLETFTEKEIETVFAHELGHYKKGHVVKNIFISLFGTFAGLFIMSKLYELLLPVFGFIMPYEIAALPLLAAIAAIYSFLLSPLTNAISRKFEFEADRFAIDTTKDPETLASTMTKLADQNLADDEPNKIVEFWSYSHPSIKRRIEAASSYYRLKYKGV